MFFFYYSSLRFLFSLFFFLLIRCLPGATLFPYTTLFRSTATCTGRYSEEFTITEPATNSFQDPMNTKMLAAPRLGRHNGSTTEKNVRNLEAPSRVAASSSSVGTPSIAPLMIQTAIGRL